MLALSFRDITAPDDLRVGIKAMVDLTRGRSAEFSFQKRYVTCTGGRVWARTTGITVRDASGSLLRVIVQVEDLTLQRASEALLSRRESHDELTNVANRRTFYERLDAALQMPRRSTRAIALLVVNLDRFHQINAGLGHESGDTVLREVARRLTAVVRGQDVVARLGGDEFAVLSLGMRTPLDAVSLAVELREVLGRPYWSDGNAVHVSTRIGVVTNVEDSDSETLVQMAVAATQQAKTLAGGWALHTQGANTSSHEELGLVNDLRTAISDGGLTVAYQPVVDLSGRVRYVEALARWYQPERGAIPPDQFIALAEQNGLIEALTTQVMTVALRQVAVWRAAGIQACVAVNLSGRLLAAPDLAGRVASLLAAAGVPATSLTLEITETALAEGSNPELWAVLDALRSSGVRISIDDFGTGYSSLTYLKELPVDELKIDRSFVLDLDTDDRTERIVRSIIDLAHSLDLTVVAEGVEDAVVADGLRGLGVDFVQGYAIRATSHRDGDDRVAAGATDGRRPTGQAGRATWTRRAGRRQPTGGSSRAPQASPLQQPSGRSSSQRCRSAQQAEAADARPGHPGSPDARSERLRDRTAAARRRIRRPDRAAQRLGARRLESRQVPDGRLARVTRRRGAPAPPRRRLRARRRVHPVRERSCRIIGIIRRTLPIRAHGSCGRNTTDVLPYSLILTVACVYTVPHTTSAAELSLTSVAYDALKRRLLAGDYRIGRRLAEVALAEQLGVSRTPVREALARLHAEGFLVRLPEGGYSPAAPDLHTIAELYVVRRGLELTALHNDQGHDMGLLRALRDDWASFDPVPDEPDPDFVLHDEDYHIRLAEASGNRSLAEILGRVSERIRIVRIQDFLSAHRIRKTVTEHLSIVDALIEGDRALADRRLVRHLAISRRVVERRSAVALSRMVHGGRDG